MQYYIKLILISSICIFNSLAAHQPFVCGEVTGQFGNQLFVIAATVNLALEHNAVPVFPGLISQVDDRLLNYQKALPHLNTAIPDGQSISTSYHEPHYYYDPIPYKDNMQICGYFQSEKYFKKHKKEIVELFAPPLEIREYLKSKYGYLIDLPNTVSVHLRSYLSHDPEQKLYPLYGFEYFDRAMALFPDDSTFVVFSNDMTIAKKVFGEMPRHIIFIEGERHYHDFYLMSMCKHHIICNSSFSWWAAYLNPNPDKIVIAPPLWYTSGSGMDCRDLLPEEWIILQTH